VNSTTETSHHTEEISVKFFGSRSKAKTMLQLLFRAVVIVGLICQVDGFNGVTTRLSPIIRLSPMALSAEVSSVETDKAKSINIPFDDIKNMRDIAQATTTVKVVPSKIFRTGCVSKASDADITKAIDTIGIKTWIDLRSPAELEEDEHLNSKIYDGFQTFRYDKRQKLFSPEAEKPGTNGRKRFFISLMSESLIKKGIFFRLRKRDRAQSSKEMSPTLSSFHPFHS